MFEHVAPVVIDETNLFLPEEHCPWNGRAYDIVAVQSSEVLFVEELGLAQMIDEYPSLEFYLQGYRFQEYFKLVETTDDCERAVAHAQTAYGLAVAYAAYEREQASKDMEEASAAREEEQRRQQQQWRALDEQRRQDRNAVVRVVDLPNLPGQRPNVERQSCGQTAPVGSKSLQDVVRNVQSKNGVIGVWNLRKSKSKQQNGDSPNPESVSQSNATLAQSGGSPIQRQQSGGSRATTASARSRTASPARPRSRPGSQEDMGQF